MSLDALLGGQTEAPERQCSRRGCGNRAVVALLWNNPRIHTPDRRKTWLACADHEEWLTSYLTDRGLYRSTEALAP